MARTRSFRPALRSQLLGGLALIIVVVTISVGGITTWTLRDQIDEVQLVQARLLGDSLARLVAGACPGSTAERAAALKRMVRVVGESPPVQAVDVVDRRMELVASSRPGASGRLDDPEVAAALRSEGQVVSFNPGAGSSFSVSTPLFAEGELCGVVRLRGQLGRWLLDWPGLFWILMGVDGVLLLLFVGFVFTRYVMRPLGAMRRAAEQVRGGDLSVRLAEEGARDFASLAASFNAMTTSVAEQLERLEQQRRELAASREQLIRSEKLASVGRLAAGVAHEVGNPLHSIIGFTEMLLGEQVELPEREDFLRRIRGEAQRIHHIVRELLDFARPVEDAIEPVHLDAVIEQSIQLVGPQRRLREVEIRRLGLEGLPPAAASAARLVQVLVNLLLNAADAMEGRGTLSLAGRHLAAEGLVELRLANSGPPIAAELHRRIFDPFFTTKEPGEGTGLGLSVAQSIVESYGGRLALAEDAEATTFVIALKVWQES